MDKKKIITFNIENARAAFRTKDGSYSAPISIGQSSALSLEVETTETPIYGDGKYATSFTNTSVAKGSLTLLDVSDEFEIAAGRKIRTSQGLLEIMQNTNPEFALLFDITEGYEDGSQVIAKNACFHCLSPKAPALKTSQTTASGISASSFELELKIWGEPLKCSDGTVYKDENGREKLIWKQSVTPEEDGFETFGETVTIPTVPKA